jgi:hypothetical protein
MEIYAYAKKKTVFTDQFLSELAARNRAQRIAKYPETAQFVAVQAEFSVPPVSTVRKFKLK